MRKQIRQAPNSFPFGNFENRTRKKRGVFVSDEIGMGLTTKTRDILRETERPQVVEKTPFENDRQRANGGIWKNDSAIQSFTPNPRPPLPSPTTSSSTPRVALPQPHPPPRLSLQHPSAFSAFASSHWKTPGHTYSPSSLLSLPFFRRVCSPAGQAQLSSFTWRARTQRKAPRSRDPSRTCKPPRPVSSCSPLPSSSYQQPRYRRRRHRLSRCRKLDSG